MKKKMSHWAFKLPQLPNSAPAPSRRPAVFVPHPIMVICNSSCNPPTLLIQSSNQCPQDLFFKGFLLSPWNWGLDQDITICIFCVCLFVRPLNGPSSRYVQIIQV